MPITNASFLNDYRKTNETFDGFNYIHRKLCTVTPISKDDNASITSLLPAKLYKGQTKNTT